MLLACLLLFTMHRWSVAQDPEDVLPGLEGDALCQRIAAFRESFKNGQILFIIHIFSLVLLMIDD
jgi:hypothetical protein